MRRARFLTTLLLLCSTCGAFAGETPAARAQAVLKASPFDRGVACIPDCGNGELTMALAEQSEMLILAMDEDGKHVARLQEQAAKAGLLGRRLYVEQGSIDSIPFADHYVDLLALPHLKQADLAPAQKAEILRVLTPIHGTAVLADGKIVKPELGGSDWWFHKRHDPGNNPVSEDTIFQFPPVLQYKAMPMYTAYQQATLSGNGIQYEINPWQYEKGGARLNLCGRIFARSIYNGRILWEATTPSHVIPTRPTSVLTEDELLIAREEQGGIARFDAMSGEELPPLEIGDEDTRIRWLVHEKGVLFTLLGKPGEQVHPFLWKGRIRMKGGKEQFYGSEFTAWSMKDEKVLWKHAAPGAVDYRTVAVHQGRIFFYAEDKGLFCLNAAGGTPLWENRQSEWPEDFKRPPTRGNMLDTSTLIVADGLIQLYLMAGALNWRDIKSPTLVFRAEDGKLLSRMEWNQHKSMIVDGALINGSAKYDPDTGKKIEGGNLPSPAGMHWCGLTTYAPGTGVLGHSTLNYKASCSAGAWVAGGVLSYAPSICDCGPQLGAGGFVSGAAIVKRFKENPEHPFIKGPAFDALPSRPSLAPSADWAQYRGAAGHRGSSSAEVGRHADIVWRAEPEHPFTYTTLYNNHVTAFDERPVPPVCVGETLFTAGSDGIVRALSLADGREIWHFAAGGPVMTSPAWSGGMLFIPGCDGWIYALDAASGALAWKRRLAPFERRIMMFDQLVSTWPVLSLVAEPGTVYAAAGHTPTEGVKTFALDAPTGEIRWSHVDEPAAERFQGSHNRPDRAVQGIGGSMSIVNDRVWAAGYFTQPLALDRSDGTDHGAELKRKLLAHTWSLRGHQAMRQRGRDVVRIDDRLVLAGGGDLFENHQMREGKRARTEYRLYYCDGEGDWMLEAGPRKIFTSRIAPACDDELLVSAGPPRPPGTGYEPAVGDATLGLYAWQLADFREAAAVLQKKPFLFEKSGRLLVDQKAMGRLSHEGAAWQRPELYVNALALSRNAVLVAHSMQEELRLGNFLLNRKISAEDARSPNQRFKGWKLAAFSRDGKETLWEVDLPEEPLYNGIAIARDGSVLVTLRDGSIVCLRGGDEERNGIDRHSQEK